MTTLHQRRILFAAALLAPVMLVSPSPAAEPAEDFRTCACDTVHFDRDRYAVPGDQKVILRKQAAWLIRHPQVRIVVAGYTDDRGSREYDLALGSRYAQAVNDYLAAQGVAERRIETESYGRDRPVCSERTATCRAANRRAVTTVHAESMGEQK